MKQDKDPSAKRNRAKEIGKNIYHKLFFQELRRTKLRNIGHILHSDVRRIFSSVICLVMLFGLCVVPCLYAWFNIFSNWDPYGVSATSRIKVAVVSEDEGMDLFGLHLNVGEKVISGLESNDQIGWQFKDSLDDALESVYSGDCYAALVVPETFTADIASFLTLDFDHPQLLYYENDKKNAIAPKITGKAKTAVQEQVNATVMETVGGYIGDIVGVFTENGVTPEDLVSSVNDTIENAQDKLNTLDSALGSLVATLNSAQSMTYYSAQLFTHTSSNLSSIRNANDNVINDVKDKTSGTISDTVDTIKKVQEVIDTIIAELKKDQATGDSTDTSTASSTVTDFTTISESGTSDSPAVAAETESQTDAVSDAIASESTEPQAIENTQDVALSSDEAGTSDSVINEADNQDDAGIASEAVTDPAEAITALSDSLDALTETVSDFSVSLTEINDSAEQVADESPVATAQSMTDSSLEATNEASSTAVSSSTSTSASQANIDDIQKTIDEAAKAAEKKAIEFFNQVKPTLDLLMDILNNPTKYNDQLFNQVITPMDAISSRLYDLSSRLGDTANSLSTLRSSLQIINDDLERVQGILSALVGSDYLNDLMDSLSGNYENLGSFFASPITMETKVLYPIDNYGSAMAPFYTVLAQWVGSLFCICLLKTRIRKEDIPMELTMQEKFFGRFGVFFVCALLQAIIVAAGDLWYVGIDCAHPGLFFLACITTGICFIIINYSLLFALENIGLGASVIIMVIQVAGSGGSYPVQVVPEIFRKLYPYMPFNYAMNSMREAIGGTYDHYFLKYQLVMLLISAIFLLLGQLLYNPAHRLNQLIFDSKSKSEVMIP